MSKRSMARPKNPKTKTTKPTVQKTPKNFWLVLYTLCLKNRTTAALEPLERPTTFLLKHAANTNCYSAAFFCPTFQRLTHFFDTATKLLRKWFLHSNSWEELE